MNKHIAKHIVTVNIVYISCLLLKVGEMASMEETSHFEFSSLGFRGDRIVFSHLLDCGILSQVCNTRGLHVPKRALCW